MSIEILTAFRRLVLEFLRGKKSCRKSLNFGSKILQQLSLVSFLN